MLVLLEQLGKIREVGVVYPAQDKRRSPTLKMTLSQTSVRKKTLYDVLNLYRYLRVGHTQNTLQGCVE